MMFGWFSNKKDRTPKPAPEVATEGKQVHINPTSLND